MAPPPPTLSFPDPMVIPPAALPHKQTFILLHGRGSSAARFGPALLCEHITSSSEPPLPPHPHEGLTLAALFPHARFVFPTAPRQRATIYKRSVINQWFDDWHLVGGPGGGENDKDDNDKIDELQVSGLRETVVYLHGLIRREAALVGGARRVVLGGLSQGCASSLVAALLWDGDGKEEEPLGAVVGMCGYLPYRVHIEEAVKPGLGAVAYEDEDEDEGVFDPFDRGDDGPAIGDVKGGSPCQIAASWLRDELDLPPASHSKSCGIERTPVFLGHGTLDEKVAIERGRDAARCLSDLGLDVTWKEYSGLGHWYSNDMLHDIIQFLREKTS